MTIMLNAEQQPSANVAPELSQGERAILKRLARQPIEFYWGRNGWVPNRLPRAAKRKDLDSLLKRQPALVKVHLGNLILAQEYTAEQQQLIDQVVLELCEMKKLGMRVRLDPNSLSDKQKADIIEFREGGMKISEIADLLIDLA